jgi:hypothetical protein
LRAGNHDQESLMAFALIATSDIRGVHAYHYDEILRLDLYREGSGQA